LDAITDMVLAYRPNKKSKSRKKSVSLKTKRGKVVKP
jgi:hypothetical protein